MSSLKHYVIKGIMLLQCLSFLFSVYFDVSQNCHSMAFSFGQTAIGTTTPTTRSFSIKVIFTNILIFFLMCPRGKGLIRIQKSFKTRKDLQPMLRAQFTVSSLEQRFLSSLVQEVVDYQGMDYCDPCNTAIDKGFKFLDCQEFY